MNYQVSKTIIKALDNLEQCVNNLEEIKISSEVSEDKTETIERDISLALTINGIMVMLKRLRGEDSSDVLNEYEKCKKAFEKIREFVNQKEKKQQPSSSSVTTTTSSSKKRENPSSDNSSKKKKKKI